MIIQSTRVWVSGQFMEAQVEMVDGKIAHIYPYGTKEVDVEKVIKNLQALYQTIE